MSECEGQAPHTARNWPPSISICSGDRSMMSVELWLSVVIEGRRRKRA